MKRKLIVIGLILATAIVITVSFIYAKHSTQTQITKIYNLILLDKSGSMNHIQEAAYKGCNEVLTSIHSAQNMYASSQKHFVSLMLFDSYSMPYIHKLTPANETIDLKENDYCPQGLTPLLDAMGYALMELKTEVEKQDFAVGVVTIITDGLENDSREWNTNSIANLVDELKEMGWTFAFIGTNQDVMVESQKLHIDNSMQFEYNEDGIREAWSREKKARTDYYKRVSEDRYDKMSQEQLRKTLRQKGENYYSN